MGQTRGQLLVASSSPDLQRSTRRDRVDGPAARLRPGNNVLIAPQLPDAEPRIRGRELPHRLLHQPSDPRLAQTEHRDQLAHRHYRRLRRITHPTDTTQMVCCTTSLLHYWSSRLMVHREPDREGRK